MCSRRAAIAQSKLRRGDAECFEHRAHGDLTGVTIQVVDAGGASIETMYDDATIAGQLKAPGLRLSPLGAHLARSKMLCKVLVLSMVLGSADVQRDVSNAGQSLFMFRASKLRPQHPSVQGEFNDGGAI